MTNPVSEWILRASSLKDPVAEAAGTVADASAKTNWLLLASALQQGINLGELRNFIIELQKNMSDVAQLPAPAENLILDAIAKCRLKNWSLAPYTPGIVWSVGRFARARENRLDLWVQKTTPSDIWRSCGEIYYMGKTSALRPKVLGFLYRIGKWEVLPFSAGARRWLVQAKTYDVQETPKEKLRAINNLYKNLYPKNPALACHALAFFAEPFDEESFFCQKIFPCNLCPVSGYCRWWR
jgi:hypothetical protein